MNGALLVDKPSGPTSHDVVAFTRRLLKTKRVGHTGTLDPLATGLLVMLVGHATRLSQFLVADEKEYVADVRLGVATRTYDAASLDETAIRCPTSDGRWPTKEDVVRILPDFLGTFPQLPPPYSAKKVAGIRAYEKARKGEAIDLKPVEVTVRELELLDTSTIDHRPSTIDHRPSTIDHRPSTGLLRLRVVASSGFYVRSLAHDIGQVLGCGGHLEALRRTRVGRFSVEDAATLDVLEEAGQGAVERLISLNALLADLPAVTLTAEGLRRAGNGNALAPEHLASPAPLGATDRIRVLDAAGEVLSVAERRRDGLLHPLLVLR
jgi:tRNA pseudouridine55 synthase